MEGKVRIFSNERFGEIRTAGTSEEPLFCLADVCRAIGIKDVPRMRSNGFLGTKGERYNIPNQQYVEQGLFEIKKGVRSGNDGVMHTTITTKVTGKGQSYFINKFIGVAP